VDCPPQQINPSPSDLLTPRGRDALRHQVGFARAETALKALQDAADGLQEIVGGNFKREKRRVMSAFRRSLPRP